MHRIILVDGIYCVFLTYNYVLSNPSGAFCAFYLTLQIMEQKSSNITTRKDNCHRSSPIVEMSLAKIFFSFCFNAMFYIMAIKYF